MRCQNVRTSTKYIQINKNPKTAVGLFNFEMFCRQGEEPKHWDNILLSMLGGVPDPHHLYPCSHRDFSQQHSILFVVGNKIPIKLPNFNKKHRILRLFLVLTIVVEQSRFAFVCPETFYFHFQEKIYNQSLCILASYPFNQYCYIFTHFMWKPKGEEERIQVIIKKVSALN